MKKILVTGSTGLVGKNFVNHSQSSQYQILAPRHSELDLLNSQDVVTYLKEKKPELHIIQAKKSS
jgi:GDP-L-fucose synthase